MAGYTGQPTVYGSPNINGNMLNDSFKPLTDNENILIAVNGNNPPSVLQNTSMFFYNTDSVTISSTETLNDVYPESTTDTYLKLQTIFEPSNQTFAWNSGNFPAQSDGEWYLYTTGTSSTVKFTGVYGASKNAITWSDEKNGWYNSDGKVICCFTSTGGVVSNVRVFKGRSKVKGYADFAIENTATAITIKEPCFDIEGKSIEYLQDVIIDLTGIAAGWKYFFASDFIPGDIQLAPNTSFDQNGSTWNPSGNQLDMFSTYDHDRKYCYLSASAGVQKLRCIAAVYWTGSAVTKVLPIYNTPYTNILATRNSNLTIPAGVLANLQPDTIDYDLNSEWDIVTNDRYDPLFSQNITGAIYANFFTAGLTSKRSITIAINNITPSRSGWDSGTLSTSTATLSASITGAISTGDYLTGFIFTANASTLTGTNTNQIRIVGSK